VKLLQLRLFDHGLPLPDDSVEFLGDETRRDLLDPHPGQWLTRPQREGLSQELKKALLKGSVPRRFECLQRAFSGSRRCLSIQSSNACLFLAGKRAISWLNRERFKRKTSRSRTVPKQLPSHFNSPAR